VVRGQVEAEGEENGGKMKKPWKILLKRIDDVRRKSWIDWNRTDAELVVLTVALRWTHAAVGFVGVFGISEDFWVGRNKV
jgi:hypothetical protein